MKRQIVVVGDFLVPDGATEDEVAKIINEEMEYRYPGCEPHVRVKFTPWTAEAQVGPMRDKEEGP